MAKRTISFDNYKDREFDDYTGEDPRPGIWLTGQVNRAKYLEDDDQVVFYVTVVDHPDFTGWTRGVYAPLDPEDTVFWKTQDIILALTGKKAAVTVDWENEAAVANFLKKCHKIRFKTREYNDKMQIGSTRPLLEAVGTKASPQAAKATPTATKAAEPEPVSDDQLEDYTEADLELLAADELEEILVEEFEVPEDELPAKPTRDRSGAKYKAALIEAILEEQEGGEDEPEAAEGEGDDEEFSDGFPEEDPEPEPEPEPEPAPAPRTRRTRAAAKPEPEAAPAPAPAARTRRRRA